MAYNITAMPTFIFILNGREVSRIRGADQNQLRGDIIKFAALAKPLSGAGFSGSGRKLGAEGEEKAAPKASSSKPAARPAARPAGAGRTVGGSSAQSSGWLGTVVSGAIALGMLYFVSLFTVSGPRERHGGGLADDW